MGNVHANIKPNRMDQRDEVDAICMAFRALQALCAKLDDDGDVPLNTYEANVITNKINLSVTDSKGNRFSSGATPNSTTIGPHVVISPTGITPEARVWAGYYFWEALETLAEQLDTDTLGFSNYEATAFTAICRHSWRNNRGVSSGRGTTYYFGPAASGDNYHYINDLYDRFAAIYALCHDGTTTGLDGDGNITATDFESTVYTGYLTLMVEDSAGSQIGASR